MKDKETKAQVEELKRRGWELLPVPDLNQADGGILYLFMLPLNAMHTGTVQGHVLTINEAVCCDCGGQVEYFNVSNAAWNGLGFNASDFACLECVAKRLNPNNPPDSPEELAKQIDKRFPSAGYGLQVVVLGNAERGRKYKAGVDLQAKHSGTFTVSIRGEQ